MNSLVNPIKNLKILTPVKKIYWRYIYIVIGIRTEIKDLLRKGKAKYFIIGYNDTMHIGWTVWERIVLYNSIYAEEKGLIPVVDMKNYSNIYQEIERGENSWEMYYRQPGGILLADALKSSYIRSNDSYEWFIWIRKRRKKLKNNEYLRLKYSKYIRHLDKINNELSSRWKRLVNVDTNMGERGLALCIRGSDYVTFNHGKQPNVSEISSVAKKLYNRLCCNYIFIVTEDEELFHSLLKQLNGYPLRYFDSRRVKNDYYGYIGEAVRNGRTAYDTSMEYLSILYGMKQCCCLMGGGQARQLFVNMENRRHMNTMR